MKSLALSAHVSIHFQVLDRSPLSGPGRDPLFCNGGVLKNPQDAFQAPGNEEQFNCLVKTVFLHEKQNKMMPL